MKTFVLKGKPGTDDLPFTLYDLLPLPQTKSYDFFQLVKFIDYRFYCSDTNWTNEDYLSLYLKPGHHGKNFFTIRDTGVVVIPGTCLFPTILNDNAIL